MNANVIEELERRRHMFNQIIQAYPTGRNVPPGFLRGLRVYSGQQGIYFDKANTSGILGAKESITVSVLHTGHHYPDDFSDRYLLYHYPDTRRAGHDEAEIRATKNACRVGMPIFVISYSQAHSDLRDIFLGFVEGWDDASKVFLITIYSHWVERSQYPHVLPEKLPPFQLADQIQAQESSSPKHNSNQPLFKFRVLQRYGPKCAVCSVDRKEMLRATHLRPVTNDGSDDPRNGLILCANHHLAFNANLFAFDNSTLKVVFRPQGPNAHDLQITVDSLRSLPELPDQRALAWRYRYWKRVLGL
jgi:putative restriction endonuclease